MMKIHILIYSLLFLLIAVGCDKKSDEEFETVRENDMENGWVSEDHFVVQFTPEVFPQTKAPVYGNDTRIQHVRYIIYRSTGEYVKEKVILSTSGPALWPLPAIRDTLPRGEYKVVFLGNVDKTLFPYRTEEGGPDKYADVLLDHTTSYNDARIALPPAEFSANTEYYWDTTTFSDINPNPDILLQRIIGSVEMKRVLIDAQAALDMLVGNIVEQVNAGDLIQNTVEGVLPGLINTVLQPIFDDILGVLAPLNVEIPVIGGGLLDGIIAQLTELLDGLLNPLTQGLVGPLVEVLYDVILQELVSQIATALTSNADKNGLLEHLGDILNPWNSIIARGAIVSIDDYPKTIDFGLNSVDVYAGTQNFLHEFNDGSISEDRFITLKTFAGTYNVGGVSVDGVGLVSGLLVEGVVDDFLLQGALVDVDDQLLITGAANRRYQSSYSLLGIGTKQSVKDTVNTFPVTVRLGDVLNVDSILGPILEPLLGGVSLLLEEVLDLLDNPLIAVLPIVGEVPGILNGLVGGLQENILDGLKELQITIDLPINLSLLNVDNLEVSGSWGPLTEVP